VRRIENTHNVTILLTIWKLILENHV
jgi:hypothetical protein